MENKRLPVTMKKDQLEDRLGLMEANIPIGFLHSPMYLDISLLEIERYLNGQNGDTQKIIRESFNSIRKKWSELYDMFKEPGTKRLDKYSGLYQRMILEPIAERINTGIQAINQAFEQGTLGNKGFDQEQLVDLKEMASLFIEVAKSYSDQKIHLKHYLNIFDKCDSKEVMKYFNKWMDNHLAKLEPYAKRMDVQLDSL